MKLSRLGEFGLIERISRNVKISRGVRLGIGDDAAWVEHRLGSSLITADLLIEGVHFDLKWTSLADLGCKSLAVNLSDIAAMGGTPAYVMLSLGIPKNFDSGKIDQLYRGIGSLAKKHRVSIIGGDTNIAETLLISVCVIGDPPARPIRRAGARPGDDLYVTGTLGDSALALALLRGRVKRPNSAEKHLLARHHRPTPRLAAGALLAKRNLASAMIDISDGLIQDLGHICQASQVGAKIELDKLPLSAAYRALAGNDGLNYALSGGEDYELLFTAAPRLREKIAALSKPAGVAFTRIGRCAPAGHGIELIDATGRRVAPRRQGHDHFKKN